MEHEYCKFRGRLALFRAWENRPADWEAKWASMDVMELLKQHASGSLGELELLADFLPRGRPIIEAGCGLGQIVMALAARGYCAEGLDYSERTVDRVRAAMPLLSVRMGDVYAIAVPDGYYAGYVSLGVLEHDPNGPSRGLREARRVLGPEGWAAIAVPYLNKPRAQLLERLSVEGSRSSHLSFYQFYFDVREFTSLLEEAGLALVRTHSYATYAGLTRNNGLGLWLEQRGFLHWRLRRLAERLCADAPRWVRLRWAHMMLYVCRPV